MKTQSSHIRLGLVAGIVFAATLFGCAQMFDSELLESVEENIANSGSSGERPLIDGPLTPSPADGSTVDDATPQFGWEDVVGAEEYQIQVGIDSGFNGELVVDVDQLTVSQYDSEDPLQNEQTFYWHVRVKNDGGEWGPWSETWHLNVLIDIDDPLNPSPAVGSTGGDTTPFLDWDGITNASSYDLQVNTDPDFSGETIVDETNLIQSQYQISTPIADNESYFWRVRGEDEDGTVGPWSAGWYFLVNIPSPGMPTPAHESSTIDTSPLLDWADVEYGESYDIQINTSAEFSGLMVEEANVTTSSQYQVTTAALSDKTSYYWRVRAVNEDGVAGDWCAGWQLDVEIAPPLLSSPGDGGITSHSYPLFEWSDVAGALSYHFQINDVDDFATGLEAETGGLTSTSTELSVPLSDMTTYYWRVRTENEDGVLGGWSNSAETTIHLPTMIVAMQYYSLALLSDGSVWTWGRNQDGQIGDGTTNNRLTPYRVSIPDIVTTVGSGRSHSVVARSGGGLWAWGYNRFGQLGDSTTTGRLLPVQVSTLTTTIVDIAGGRNHTIALKGSNGEVWVWGDNSYGQLGDNTTTDSHVPIEVTAISNALDVAAGHDFCAVLLSGGAVKTWGMNEEGQLGDNSTTDRHVPVNVSGLGAGSGVTAVDAGDYHTMALKSDGTVWAWGNNSNGLLGDGSTDDSSVPVQVQGLTGIDSIEAGLYHSTALQNDGTVWTWGYNSDGQLGDGTTARSLVPIQVDGLSEIVQLAAGGTYTMALQNDGTIWVFGSNQYGQLGDGTTTRRLTPVPIRIE